MIKNILSKIPRKKGKVTGYPAPDNDLTYQTKTQYPLHFKTTASNETQSDDELPSLIDAPNAEKRNLFLRKLSLCCVVFDFTDPSSNSREKEIKRLTLIELVHYITSEKVRFDASFMQQIVKMVSVNLFRPLVTKSLENKAVDDFDLVEEEYLMDPAWTHLQIVYEFLLRFVVSPETDKKMVERYIDQFFITSLLDLFDSEDPREREYLKNILHRIYGKFMGHRPFIRKSIGDIFYGFIYETERHNGIAALLAILGSIISGFALPLKEEHKLFLVRTLIPLHKPKCMCMYHEELSYCIKRYVEKDRELADAVIRGILKYWPITNSSKEVMLLGEIEDVLESTQAAEFQKFMVPLFRQIARCCLSSQFQVAERALVLWSNDHIKNLITQNHKVILPIIVPALERNTRGHWNQSVKSLTLNVNKFFYDADPDFFEECLLKFQEDEAREQDDKMKREAMWRHLHKMVLQRMAEKRNLFLRKLSLCCVVFDFTDPSSNSREKEIKRLTLTELVHYITSEKEIFDGSSMEEIVRMVSVNLFRPLVTKSRENILVDEFDREKEEYLMDPAWTHLQIVYEFLLRFVDSPETDAKMAKRYIDRCFITSLLDLFDSEDPRERKYLKNILHRIYRKFMLHRPFIRKSISDIFYGFIYETERHNGIAALLEILGSIISGFVLPLKEEHKLFLVRTLIPLHKPKCMYVYHEELSYCIKGYVEKDSKLADAVIRGILKYWPISNSSKEVMLLGEIEEVLESTREAEFQRCLVPLFQQIARCCISSQLQVAERALVLWSNDHIKNLITQNHKVILPIIVPALERNTRGHGHWYLSVKSLTLGVVKSFYDEDPVFFRECLQKFQEGEAREEDDKLNREATWRRLEEMARARKCTSNETVVILQLAED